MISSYAERLRILADTVEQKRTKCLFVNVLIKPKKLVCFILNKFQFKKIYIFYLGNVVYEYMVLLQGMSYLIKIGPRLAEISRHTQHKI